VQARANLLRAVRLVLDALSTRPDVLNSVYPQVKKTRDTREPGRMDKLATEAEIARLMTRRFKLQARSVREQLEALYPERKALLGGVVDIPDDEETNGKLIVSITNAILKGIALFGDEIGIGLDFTRANGRALEAAKNYAYDLIRKIDETTRELVRSAVNTFIDTPGFTIGDIVNQLPFSESRAQMIAVTETTRAFAQGNRLAAQELKEEFPDVRVVRIWYTNNDDLVCPICGALDGKEVEGEEDFDPGIADPPAHPNCRCWTSTRTRINR
jgi:SPP1 gp7 family putative phage head morphogenesis protein